MPGALVIEALAQAGGILTQLTSGGSAAGRLSYLVKIDNAKFSRMVVPGDRLDLEVTIKREIRNMTQYCGTASVDGQQVASAHILCPEVKVCRGAGVHPRQPRGRRVGADRQPHRGRRVHLPLPRRPATPPPP